MTVLIPESEHETINLKIFPNLHYIYKHALTKKFTVSAEVAAKIFGITVGSGSGMVTVPLTGAQECQGNGTMTCQPVRCIEMIQAYSKFF